MTKLTEQNLPKSIKRGGPGMYYCEECRAFVPDKDKHMRKRHK